MNNLFGNFEYDNKKINLNNMLATLAFSVHYFIAILGGSILGMSIIYSIFFIQSYRRKIKLKKEYIVIIFILFFLLCFSELKLNFLKTTDEYFINFICFDVVLFFIGGIKFNKSKVIQYSVILGFIGLPIFIFKVSILYDNMGVGYSVLPLFLISIISLITSSSIIIKTCAICNIFTFGLFYAKEGMRGIVLAIIVFFILLLYVSLVSKIKKKYRRNFGITVIGIISVLIIVILKNLNIIILKINFILAKNFHFEIYALKKFLFYIEKGDISNGRSALMRKVVQMIKESPITGKGIGYLESNIFTYAHNIFLQVTCEFGVLGLLVITYIFIYSLRIIFFVLPYKYRLSEVEKKESVFFLVIFITGIFFLLYSSVYWIYGGFWFFLGLLVRRKLYREEV